MLQAALASDPTGGRWAKGLYRLAVALEANLRYREAYEVAKRAARFVSTIDFLSLQSRAPRACATDTHLSVLPGTVSAHV